MTNITRGNRGNVTDAKDCGGRLGPYTDAGEPDFRNLAIYFSPCQKGDIILLCSDGVHGKNYNLFHLIKEDNMDPQQLGKTPKDMGIDATTWEEASTNFPNKTAEAKEKHSNALISNLIKKLKKDCALIDICHELASYCSSVTKNGRDWMEANPNGKLPEDYVQYPGKTVCFPFCRN